MALPIDQLVTPMTPDQVKAWFYRVLATLGVNTTTWKPLGVVRAMIAGGSIIGAAATSLIALIAKSGFLELAEGDWLDLPAHYVFGVDRIQATFAVGQVTLVNSGGGVYDFAPGDLIVLNPTTHKTYRNTGTLHLGAGATLTGVTIQAVEVGSASTSAPGAISLLETSLLGVTVTNPTAVVGLDAEADPAIQRRSLDKRSSLSPNGPRDAYSFFAKTTTRIDGSTIGVTRVRVSRSSATGEVTVTLATATGGITGTLLDPTTDLGAINQAFQRNVVPNGVTATPQSATPLVIPVTYEVWLYTTAILTKQQLIDLIALKLTAFMVAEPIGGNVIGVDPGKVFVDAIRTVIGSARPEIFHVVVTSPGADVTVTDIQVPTLGTVTCTDVHLVQPS